VSRLIGEITTPEVRDAGTRLRTALAAYREKEDLISIGAYQRGTDPVLDAAIALRPRINAFLRQQVDEPSTLADADTQLLALADELAAPVILSGDVMDAAPGPSGWRYHRAGGDPLPAADRVGPRAALVQASTALKNPANRPTTRP
jgi:hypothetical protein